MARLTTEQEDFICTVAAHYRLLVVAMLTPYGASIFAYEDPDARSESDVGLFLAMLYRNTPTNGWHIALRANGVVIDVSNDL